MSTKMPLEMAELARDKLQASAREIWLSIRSFDDAAGRKGEVASPQASENTASFSVEKIENVFKVMFGSCTTGAVPSSPTEAETRKSTKPFEARSMSTRSRDFLSGEHVYAQLFTDDQTRAVRAVDGLREKAASSSPSKSCLQGKSPKAFSAASTVPVVPPTTRAVDVNGDFDFDDGISAISADTLEEMARIHERKTIFPTKKTLATTSINSYPPSRRRSPDLSASPPNTTALSPTACTAPCKATTSTSPLKFTRGRSNGTTGTKSTKSSQDSEFSSFWKREEMKYWDSVVEMEKKNAQKTFAMSDSPAKSTFSEKARRRSRSGSQSTKQDVTITTACSSSFSNFSSHFDKQQHPSYHHQHSHDFIQFNTRHLANRDIFHREHPISSVDPSRIERWITVPYGSELGEI